MMMKVLFQLNEKAIFRALPTLLCIMVFGGKAMAAEKGISLQATFRDTSNALVNASGVSVNVKILSSNNCILRDENFSGQNITNGYLTLNLTNGTAASGGGYYDPGLSVAQIFDNSVVKSGLTCLNASGTVNGAVTSYTPVATDARKVRVSFLNGADTVVADFNMRSLPFATNADRLNGKADSSFLQVNSGAGVTQANVESIFNRFTKLDSILNNFNSAGTTLSANITGNAATATTATSATTATTAGNVTGTVAIANGGTGATTAASALTALLPAQTGNSGKYLTTDGTTATWATVSAGGGGTVTSVTSANTDISVATGTTTPVLTLNAGSAGGASDANKIAKLDASGLLAAAMIPNHDASKITTGTLGVARGGTGLSSGSAGAVPYFSGATTMTSSSAPTGSGQVLRWNGSSWAPNFISMFDLRSTVTGSATFGSGSVGCTSNQTLTWTSATDNLACTDISLPASQITGAVAAANGGTGQSSYTTGDLLYASSTSALSRLPAGTAGAVLTSNGAGTAPSWQAAGSYSWISKTANYTAVAGQAILANTSGGAFTITLPTSPNVNDTVYFMDVSGSFATNNLTIAPAGSDIIMGQAGGTTLTVDIKHIAFALVYTGATYGWRMY